MSSQTNFLFQLLFESWNQVIISYGIKKNQIRIDQLI